MKKYIIYIFCAIFTISNIGNIFAYDYYSYEDALSEAKSLTEPLISQRERELNYQNISKEEKEYILDRYKLKTICNKLFELDWKKFFSIEHMRYCYNYYDILLNKYYKLYSNLLNAEGKKALLKEEKLWLKLRDIYQDEYIEPTFDYMINQPIFESQEQRRIFEQTLKQEFKREFGIDMDYDYIVKNGSAVLSMFLKVGFVAQRTKELFNYYLDYKQNKNIVNRADIYQSTWGLSSNSNFKFPIYILNTEKELNNIYREYLISKREHLIAVNGYLPYSDLKFKSSFTSGSYDYMNYMPLSIVLPINRDEYFDLQIKALNKDLSVKSNNIIVSLSFLKPSYNEYNVRLTQGKLIRKYEDYDNIIYELEIQLYEDENTQNIAVNNRFSFKIRANATADIQIKLEYPEPYQKNNRYAEVGFKDMNNRNYDFRLD